MASGLWLVCSAFVSHRTLASTTKVSDTDIHASCSASFVRWKNSLMSSFQSLLLRIYRGRAVFTPTRRCQENSGPCPVYEAPVPSMRHFCGPTALDSKECV